MDRQQELQQGFNKYYSNLFPEEGKPFDFVSSVSAATEKAKDCLRKGMAIEEEYSGLASEYYCLASFVCLEYMLENGTVESLYDKGNEAAERALTILPKDYEYQIFTLIYRILSISVDKDGSEASFRQLQQIHRECPPFHIVSNALFKPEWLEDVYNHLFEKNLQEVCQKIGDDSSFREDAALLLKSFPSSFSKLLALYELSQFHLSRNNYDEALRNAKLGVEVLGSNIEYDYHVSEYWLWGECWSLVGIISRKNKDYDFAEGVLEKGARLGIISCMIPLAEMYEKGECDDPDTKEAERYRAMAESFQIIRDKEWQEQQELIRKEEESRLAKIREQEEKVRLAEEMERRKNEIRLRKVLLWFGIVVCALGIVAGIVYLGQENIVDRVVKYERAGLAVLNVQDSGPNPYAIVMNKEGIYYDNLIGVVEVVPVGIPIKTNSVTINYDRNGLKATVVDSEQDLLVKTSIGQNVICTSPNSFLILNTRLSEDVMISPQISIEKGYLIIKDRKSKKNISNETVISVPSSITDGTGFLTWSVSGDVMDLYGSDYRSSFPRKDYLKIVERQYGSFVVDLGLSLTSGSVSFRGPVVFDKLKRNYSPNEIGSIAHKESMKSTIRKIFRDELIDSYLSYAAQVTGVSNRANMRVSPDDMYTFVVDPGYYSGEEKMALFRVNNKTKEKSIIDSAMEVEYQANRIRVRKHSTFLIFFDSYKDIYYNYQGARL